MQSPLQEGDGMYLAALADVATQDEVPDLWLDRHDLLEKPLHALILRLRSLPAPPKQCLCPLSSDHFDFGVESLNLLLHSLLHEVNLYTEVSRLTLHCLRHYPPA